MLDFVLLAEGNILNLKMGEGFHIVDIGEGFRIAR